MKLFSGGPIQVLRRLEAHPVLSLLPRLLVVVYVFFPRDWRFIRSPFRMDDVEPWVLEQARLLGVNLADPAAWPSATGVALRYALLPLVALAGWYVLSRVRRMEPGRIRFVALLLGWPVFPLLLGLAGWKLFSNASVFSPSEAQVAVWGGWVKSRNLSTVYQYGLVIQFLLLAGLLEVLTHFMDMGARLRESQDLALRARLAPHFLLNSFNTLIAQIEESPREAAATAERLSSLFRGVMEASRSATVPLRQELSFAEDLLALAKDRFGERLQVKVEIPEELLERPVPVLGLQVLVENALKHGVEPRKAGGTVRLAAWEEGGDLRVAVTDPGDGSSGERGTGQSLNALRQRLRRPSDLSMGPAEQGFEVAFRWRG